MNESTVRSAIHEAIQSTAVVDPHCHLDPGHPSSRSFTDILLYHHVWIELVSSGMPQNEVTVPGLPQELVDPGMDPLERMRRARPYLPGIRNTVSSLFLRWILRDLFQWEEDLAFSDPRELQERMDGILARDGWAEEVFQRCRIERCISVEKGQKEATQRILKGAETLGMVNLVDGKRTARETLDSKDAELGREIRSAEDYRAYLEKRLDLVPLGSLMFLGAWVEPSITDELATEEGITRILGRARDEKTLSREETGSFCYYGLCAALDHLRTSKLRTIQVIVGADVLPPHRSITQWDGRFSGALARIAGAYEEFRFNVSTASDHFLQDIAILAKHVPNISVAGYWWHTLYPHYIRSALETRLDIVPANKIIAFFSDAYHCEWIYPKLRLVSSILEDILVQRVMQDRYSLPTAASLVPTLLHDAPTDIYLR